MLKMISSVLTCLVMVNFAFSRSAAAEHSGGPPYKSKSVIFGTGVINDCKYFHLLSCRPLGDGDLDVGVSSDDKNFGRTRDWFNRNIFSTINSKPITDTQSKDFLFLYTKPHPMEEKNQPDEGGNFLLDFPLDSETLGPDYLEKIEELITDHD